MLFRCVLHFAFFSFRSHMLNALDQGTKDAPAPRPNKRPRTEPSPSDPKHVQLTKELDVQPKGKNAEQLDEFMQVMKPRNKKGPSWANEASSQTVSTNEPASKAVPRSEAKGKPDEMEVDVVEPEDNQENGEEISDLDWMKRRVSQAADLAPAVEKAFEQSDDEDGGARGNSKVNFFVTYYSIAITNPS